MDWNKLTFITMILSFVFLMLRRRLGSPLVSILSHWLRWCFLSLAFAYITLHWAWMDRPFGNLTLMAFLGWFLLETTYNWISIRVLSYSSMRFFPTFKLNATHNEWPNQVHFIHLREWLRAHQFEQVAFLKSDVFSSLIIHSAVYYDASKTTRLQILFIPSGNRLMTTFFILTSKTESRDRIITDNIHIPFAGFYPANWSLERKPLIVSLSKLYACHKTRLKSNATVFLPWQGNSLDDINAQQRVLEQANREKGFLFPTHLHESHGQITLEGRYRIWKEIWLLRYFGRSLS